MGQTQGDGEMEFYDAKIAIVRCYIKYPKPCNRRRALIQQVLLAVARKIGKDCANGLIHIYSLNFSSEGGHPWFKTDTSAWETKPAKILPLIEGEDFVYKKLNVKKILYNAKSDTNE